VNEKEFGVMRAQDVIRVRYSDRSTRLCGVGQWQVRAGYRRFAYSERSDHRTGANTASRCAERLSGELLKDVQADEAFCRETAEKLWQAGRAATEWTNLMLQAPPPHVLELFVAAAQKQALADELVQNFDSPRAQSGDLRDSSGCSGMPDGTRTNVLFLSHKMHKRHKKDSAAFSLYLYFVTLCFFVATRSALNHSRQIAGSWQSS
jgi:hypothetical protein